MLLVLFAFHYFLPPHQIPFTFLSFLNLSPLCLLFPRLPSLSLFLFRPPSALRRAAVNATVCIRPSHGRFCSFLRVLFIINLSLSSFSAYETEINATARSHSLAESDEIIFPE